MVQSNCVSNVITDNFKTVRFEEISFKNCTAAKPNYSYTAIYGSTRNAVF